MIRIWITKFHFLSQLKTDKFGITSWKKILVLKKRLIDQKRVNYSLGFRTNFWRRAAQTFKRLKCGFRRTTQSYIMNVNDQKSKWFIFSLLIWILIIFSSIFYSIHVKRSSNYAILNVLLQFLEVFMQNVLHYKFFQFLSNRM